MAWKKLSQHENKGFILKLKAEGNGPEDVPALFRNMSLVPPSKPTILKYYNMDAETQAKAESENPYSKKMAFDDVMFISVITKAFEGNPKVTVSAIYDLLVELFVDSGKLARLPGNEQTLRNNIRSMKDKGVIPKEEKERRVYDIVDRPPAGRQVQLDYGELRLNDGSAVFFICLVLTYSHIRWVRFLGHKFNGKDTCQALNSFFLFIGGRVTEVVIDQDACLVTQETFGEVQYTKDFKYYLDEQQLKCRVCRKADPEGKGLVENSVKYTKSNYLSSRMDKSLNDIIEGASGWIHRANMRLDTATCASPDDIFQNEEKPSLLPLLPSAYSSLSVPATRFNAGPEHFGLYRTNKYILPYQQAYKDTWYLAVGERIMFYTDEGMRNLLCEYPLPSPEVKKAVFGNDRGYNRRDKKDERVESVIAELKEKHGCLSLQHFINGVLKENPRYQYQQLNAILGLMEKGNVGNDVLEKVLEECCRGYHYKLTAFQSVLDAVMAGGASQPSADEDGQQRLDFPDMPEVQHREMDDYSEAFLRNASSGNMVYGSAK
jgi:hypothetical protein